MFGISAFSQVPLSAIPVVGGGGLVFYVNITESVTCTDTRQSINDIFFAQLVDTLNLSETQDGLVIGVLQIAEAISVNGNSTAQADMFAQIVEVINTLQTISANYITNQQINELLSGTASSVSSSVLYANAAENITVSFTQDGIVLFVISVDVAETINTAFAQTAQGTYVGLINESLTLTETQSTVTVFIAQLAEATTVFIDCRAAENVNVVELLIVNAGITTNRLEDVDVSETISLNATLTTLLNAVASVVEQTNVLDVNTGLGVYPTALNENIAVNDSMLGLRGIIRDVSESLQVSEAQLISLVRFAVISEAVQSNAVTAGVANFITTLLEGTQVFTTENATVSTNVSFSDAINVTETQDLFFVFYGTESEAISTSEVQDALRFVYASYDEAAQIASQPAARMDAVANQTESINATGVFALFIRYFDSLSEQVKVTSLMVGRNLWEPIPDSADANFQPVPDSADANWVTLPDAADANFIEINTVD